MKKKSFSFFLIASFVAHVFLALIFLNSEHLGNLFKRDKKVILPASIRVDMVSLPDLPASKKRQKAKKKKPVVVPKPKAKKKVEKKKKVAEPKKQKEKKEKVEKKKSQAEDKQTDTQNTASDSGQELRKGNRVSKGAEEGEESLSPQELSEINIYLTTVTEKIKAHWNLPKYLTDQDLTAQIEIRINEKGDIVFKQVVSSSGNPVFDSRMLKAMENATPYPPPPTVVKDLIKNGIVFDLSSRN